MFRSPAQAPFQNPISKEGVLSVPAYWEKIRDVRPADLIALWRLNESSGVQAFDSSGNGNTGEYIGGITLNNALGWDGESVPLFDGVNGSAVELTSSPVNDFTPNFNGDEGAALVWAKVLNAGAWDDGTNDMAINYNYNGANYVEVKKDAGPNKGLFWARLAGGSIESQGYTTIRSTLWMMLAITWSLSNDRMAYYYYDDTKGFLNRGSDTGLSAWTGLDVRDSYIGAFSSAQSSWNGWMQNAAVWKAELSQEELETLVIL